MDPSDEALERYARIAASLSAGGSFEASLEEENTSESAWLILEADVERSLSAALESNSVGVHPFVVRYERAVRQAQVHAHGDTTLSLAQFATAVSVLSSGASDPSLALKRAGFELADVIRAIAKHAPDLATNPAAAAVFTRLSQPSKRRTRP